MSKRRNWSIEEIKELIDDIIIQIEIDTEGMNELEKLEYSLNRARGRLVRFRELRVTKPGEGVELAFEKEQQIIANLERKIEIKRRKAKK